jgi:molybdenum cofactor cytidylyltransferase
MEKKPCQEISSIPMPTVIILASGRGERFKASGGNVHKLKALLAGKAVLQHTLDAVISSGLPWHLEAEDHPGMGDSIAAAVRATANACGWLILPADLPRIQSTTLLQVAVSLQQHEVVLPTYDGQRGHPVGFGPTCRTALLKLRGDKGAASVLKEFCVHALEVDDVGAITDIDTIENLQLAETILKKSQE